MGLRVNFYCKEKYKDRVPEPVESSKLFPKWFSNLPLNDAKYFADGSIYNLKLNGEGNNIKKCLGITDFLNTGYLIPSWTDFVFREEENGDLYVNWVENYFEEINYTPHDESQYSTMPNKPIYGHYGKVETPWVIKTDPGVSCLLTHPVWHNNKSFTTSTVIFHTDKSPLNIPWFFEWNYKIQTKMNVDNIDLSNQVVSKGEPLILIIPFYRKKYSSNINYVSDKDFENMCMAQKNLTRNTPFSKCPYVKFKQNLGKMFY